LSSIKDTYLNFYLSKGIGFIYDGMNAEYPKILMELYNKNIIQVLIVTHRLAWSMDIRANLVVILDTKYYDGHEKRYIDYSIPEIHEMLSKSGRPKKDTSSKCLLFCYTPKKESLRKFLFEPYPIESHFHHYTSEYLNAEIASNVIKDKSHCIDWLTWTFLYRRIEQNPNYYNLQGTSDTHKNDYLSELVDNSVTELEKAKCIKSDEDGGFESLNGGLVASYYYVKVLTLNIF